MNSDVNILYYNDASLNWQLEIFGGEVEAVGHDSELECSIRWLPESQLVENSVAAIINP